MNRKIMSILLSLALLMSCITVVPFCASADMTYYVNENFENVDDLQELEERPEIFQVHGGSNGIVGIANIPERGNVVEFNFSSKPSDSTDRNNFIKFNPKPGISLVGNKVVMEAKVYPTATGNHAIRLFEQTWSSHAYTSNPSFEPLVVFQNGNIEGASGAMTAYSVNEWYHIYIVINNTDNPADRTYDVYSNGELIGSSLKRSGTFTTTNTIDYINIAHRAWAAGNTYIDDVKIFEYPGFELESTSIDGKLQNVNPKTEEINLKFTSPLNPATINSIAVINSDGENMSIVPTLDSLDKSILKIALGEELEPGEEYTLSFDGLTSIMNESYDSSIVFKAGLMMMNMTSIPADGETDVSTDADIVLSFDEPVDPLTFDKAKITVSGVPSSYFDAALTAENEITITFNTKLSDGTLYTVTLADTILSTEETGSRKIFNKSFSFTTEISGMLTDDFDDYTNKMYDHSKKPDGSANFGFYEDDNGCVDNTRIALGGNIAPAHMIYYIEDGIHAFRLDKRVGNSQRPDKDAPVKIYIASEYDKDTGDGDWQDVTPPEELVSVAGLASFLTAYKHEVKKGLPENSKYLKIEMLAPDSPPANIWSPMLTSLQINHVAPPTFTVTGTTAADGFDKNQTAIEIEFSQEINDSAMSEALVGVYEGDAVSGKNLAESFEVSGNKLNIILNGDLKEGCIYTLAVEDLEDIDGIRLTPFMKTFSTGYSIKIENEILTISGESGEKYEVLIYNPKNGDELLDKFLEAYVPGETSTEFSKIYETVSDNGTATVDLSGLSSGLYNIYVRKDGSGYSAHIQYLSNVSEIMNSPDYTDNPKFLEIMLQQEIPYAAEAYEIYKTLDDKSLALKIAAEDITMFPSASGLAAALEASGEIPEVRSLLELSLTEIGLDDSALDLLKNNADYSEVTEAVLEDDFTDVATLIESIRTNSILTGIKNVSLSRSAKVFLEAVDSKRYNNATEKQKNSIAEAVANKSFDSIAELIDAIDDVKFESDKGSGGSKGGGGFGGGKSQSYADIPVIPAVDLPIPSKEEFTDLDNALWAKEAILYLKDKNIVSGKAEGIFAPDDYVTREEFVKMLVLATGRYNAQLQSGFSDVPYDHWSNSFIASAVKEGLISGIGEGRFGLGENIIRQDMCVILYRLTEENSEKTGDEEASETAEGVEPLPFDDANEIGEYAQSAVKTIFDKGIVNGMDNNTFRPMDNLTRAQAAKVIYEIIKWS